MPRHLGSLGLLDLGDMEVGLLCHPLPPRLTLPCQVLRGESTTQPTWREAVGS